MKVEPTNENKKSGLNKILYFLGRTFNHTQALHDALNKVISFKDDNYVRAEGKSEDYEGKLIHVNGELRVSEPIADPNYNILIQAVKLRKIVQVGLQSLISFTYFKFLNF